eukprot:1161003-Pelagomonas_calceolata.AAC.14
MEQVLHITVPCQPGDERMTGTKVTVVGIGGLGHLAIQFASKMGAEGVIELLGQLDGVIGD